jgi:hypothetical protein
MAGKGGRKYAQPLASDLADIFAHYLQQIFTVLYSTHGIVGHCIYRKRTIGGKGGRKIFWSEI